MAGEQYNWTNLSIAQSRVSTASISSEPGETEYDLQDIVIFDIQFDFQASWSRKKLPRIQNETEYFSA